MKKYLINVTCLTVSMLLLSCSVANEPLSIGFWNGENLFDLIDDPLKNDEEFAIGGRKNVTQEIYDLKINHSAEVLSDLNVDVLGICEVEHASVLEDINSVYKERDYKIISILKIPIFSTYSIAAPNPIAPTILGVPASNL